VNPAALLLCAQAACAFENVRVEVGDGTVLESATVVVQGGRIVQVSRGGAVPAGAQRVDGKGKVLTPGLVEVRSQLGLVEVELEPTGTDDVMEGVMVPGFRAADGFNPLSQWIPVTRVEGVTSVVARPNGVILHGTAAWADLTFRPGAAPDPSRPVAMFGAVHGPAADLAGGARGAVWLRLREAFADARFFGRNRQAVEQNRARPLSLSPLHLEALQPVLEGKIPLVLDADRASDILEAVAFARAERIRLVISGGAEAWKVARELAAAKVPVILTPSAQDPFSLDAVGARSDAAALLDKAGVPLILSGATVAVSPRRVRQDAGIAVAYGLPRDRALRAVTLAPAEVFGKAGELGTVAPGKRANLVLWSGDPLELTTVAERVFIDGEELSAETRQTRLLQRYRGAAAP
jgi:imidazolonepropionase-like amidohydrolase